MLGAFVLVMLSFPLLGMALPQASLWGVHPASLLMAAAYVQGLRMVSHTHDSPMWLPRRTRETHTADAGGLAGGRQSLAGLWLLACSAVPSAVHTGLSETPVGGVFTGLSGSLPEFITALAAIRMGALALAVGDVLGGNAFDTLIVTFCDWAYPGGSVFAAASRCSFSPSPCC